MPSRSRSVFGIVTWPRSETTLFIPSEHGFIRRRDSLESVSPYAGLSLWLETAGDELTPRPALDGDADVDVAVVGAGYTGLWTAYYLAVAEPSLRIVVLEREVAGFGASGRNGGWCSALFAASRVAAAEGIDCGYAKGGTLALATSPAHLARLRQHVEDDHAWNLKDSRWLEPAEVAERVAAAGVLGAAYSPHCARVHPGALVRGLARAAAGCGSASGPR